MFRATLRTLRKFKVAWLVIIVTVVAVGISSVFVIHNQQRGATLTLGDTTFQATIPSDEKSLVKGLSGSSSLDRSAAMVFDFPREDRWNIWMKDMNYPIDILWLDRDWIVVYIADNVAPDTYPKTFGPEYNTRYVIELAAGVAREQLINVGTKAAIKN